MDKIDIGFSGVAEFKVNAEKRTITGVAVPYGPVARKNGYSWRFQEGSVVFGDVSRIKLIRDHDPSQLLGVATELTDTPQGLRASFKIARTPTGDQALSMAEDGILDGLSVGVEWMSDGYSVDPVDSGVMLVNKGGAKLNEITLTAIPAFDSARVDGVKAMKDKEDTMTDTKADFSAISDAISAGFAKALEGFTAPVGPEVIPAGRVSVVREEAVYTMDGRGPSFVKDAFNARNSYGTAASDAGERLSKWQHQLADLGANFSGNANDEQFTTVTRTVGANIIAPNYRPDMYVPQVFKDRPLCNALSSGSISDATPFTLPKFGTSTGATADHVEGTNPTDGSLTFGTMSVTPGAISGLFKITREIVDAANPAIDSIALAAMRESYSQQTEGKIYTMLNGANGVGGTITSGQVPSGAYVATTSGQGDELILGIRSQLSQYPFRRFGLADRAFVSAEACSEFAQAVDSTGRPLLPFSTGVNAFGTSNPGQGGYVIDNMTYVPAWSMTGNTSADVDVLTFKHSDIWKWESPTLMFRYEERSGPALIELALFGYFASAILRTDGLNSIRHTHV